MIEMVNQIEDLASPFTEVKRVRQDLIFDSCIMEYQKYYGQQYPVMQTTPFLSENVGYYLCTR